jgi:translation initiation factor 3 subunit H
MAAWPRTDAAFFSLIDHRLTFSSILEEVPVVVRTSALLNALLGTLSEPSAEAVVNPGEVAAPTLAVPPSSLPPSFAPLNLESPHYLTSNLERIVEGLDDYKNEENNLGYLSRQIAREKARADTYVQKRRDENATRVAAGLAPLPEEDVARLFKVPPEPSRLESMLLLGQVDSYARTLEGLASSQLVKTFATRI